MVDSVHNYDMGKSLKKWEVFVLFLFMSILAVAYGYNDTIFLIRHGMNVWGAIFEGDGLFSFYTYNHLQTLQQQGMGMLACDAMYDFPLYLVLGLWNLPLWIVNKVSNIDVAATWWGILYGKLLFIIFLYIGSHLVKKICILLNIPKHKVTWASVIYLTSLITISSVYIIGQCDSIGIVFILGGIYFYLKNDNKKFLLFFSIAISMKFFAMPLFLALVVIKEKRIIYIARDVLLGLGITGLSRGLFSTASMDGNGVKDAFSNSMLQVILQNKLPMMNGIVPMSAFLTLMLIGICYFLRDVKKDILVWCMLAINFVFFSSFDGTPYWYMYLEVTISLFMLISSNYEKEKVLCLTLGEMALMLGHYIRYYWCYDVDKVNRTIVGKIFGMASYGESDITLWKVANLPNISIILSILYTVFVVAYLLVLVMSIVRRNTNDDTVSQQQWNRIMRYRVLCNLCIGYIPILVYLANRFSR